MSIILQKLAQMYFPPLITNLNKRKCKKMYLPTAAIILLLYALRNKIYILSKIGFTRSARLLYKTISFYFSKYLQPSVDVVNDMYHVQYNLNGRIYKLLFKRERGPKTQYTFSTMGGLDITTTIEQYLGPNKDFHGQKYTPYMMGLNNLIAIPEDGESLIFAENIIISI